MRFSSVFQQATPQPPARREPAAPDAPLPVTPPASELPDDLDARVRLIGEWQLDEGWA